MSAELDGLGTRVRLVLSGTARETGAAVRRIAAVFRRAERRFSRFSAESELSRLNERHEPMAVSRALFAALRRAQRFTEQTFGAFDPTIGTALVAAGYDRSFAPGILDRASPSGWRAPAPGMAAVVLDAARRTAFVPHGVSVDLGGMIKGSTVDAAARWLPAGGVVEAGGDARLEGAGPDGRGWVVEVEDPGDAARVVAAFRVRDRGVATSAPNRRRWRAGAEERHHLIDPRTGAPAVSDLAQVTIVAASAEEADVLATAVFVLGAGQGRRLLARLDGVAALLVHADRRLEVVGALELVPLADLAVAS
ncbi:MAG: FAD:protein FMN transferase [Polyangiaceae bacterium]|nr:FAD:protein FMN transferase [Polyangiaceae bacterium]